MADSEQQLPPSDEVVELATGDAPMDTKEDEKYAETIALNTSGQSPSLSATSEIRHAKSLIWHETEFDSEEARKFRVTGSFKDNWKEYVKQPFHMKKNVMNHEGKEEDLCFAERLAPRRIFVALKVKRISDIDNVAETYRCRFHIYFDWLLTESDYKSYCDYTNAMKGSNKKLEWIPPFRPRYEFLNIVEAHQMEEVDYGTEGQYRVQRLKTFEQKLVGFDPKKAWMCRMKLEVDATFCEELELENFPVDCQDFSIVMREGWGNKRAIFVPELRTNRKGEPSDFARVDPSFSVLDEWDFHNSRVEFRTSNPSESRSDSKYHMLTIRFKMRRKYTVYLFNFVLYMFFIAGLSLCCFTLEPAIIGERMSLAVTLLLTAVAFQDIVFEELPNVAYMTLLHQYILASFVFIACVVIETAVLATGDDTSNINMFGDSEDFDYVAAIVFAVCFVLYHLYFLVISAWKRHEESQKLYMDSEQLEKVVEEKKHQFKLQWELTEDMKFVGDGGRLASFVDVDPLLEIDNEELARTDSFCIFACLSIKAAFMSCVTFRCCRKLCHSQTKARKAHTEHRLKVENEASAQAGQ